MHFNLPSGIPQNPAEVYGDKWPGWNAWLGTPEHAFFSEQAAAMNGTIHECIECFKVCDEVPGLLAAAFKTDEGRKNSEEGACFWRRMIRRYESIERQEIPIEDRNPSKPVQRGRRSQDETE